MTELLEDTDQITYFWYLNVAKVDSMFSQVNGRLETERTEEKRCTANSDRRPAASRPPSLRGSSRVRHAAGGRLIEQDFAYWPDAGSTAMVPAAGRGTGKNHRPPAVLGVPRDLRLLVRLDLLGPDHQHPPHPQ